MNKNNLYIFLITCSILFLYGCENYLDSPVYQRPSELEGKLFTQLKELDNVSTFNKCLELSGLSEQIEKSGYYTVFAPTDDAFEVFFNNHPEYSGMAENIPAEDLNRIVRFHVLLNGWTKTQLRTLDYQGWINPKDKYYDKPRGYKRQTWLKDPNKELWVTFDKGIYTVVEPGQSNMYRRVITDSRKYIPLYYKEYMNYYGYKSEDYSYYFNRSFDGGDNIYYANGKIISDAIPAENGFIYLIDQVVPPMENMETQLLKNDVNDYSLFLNMIYKFAEFTPDIEATFNQVGADQGLLVDTLFRLTYPELSVNITNEIAGRSVNYNVRENNTIIAPINNALLRLFDEVVTVKSGYPHWPNIDVIPEFINAIIINAYMSDKTNYKSDLENGFLNGTLDTITISDGIIVEKKYCSNGVFIGIDEPIIPRAFTSVTAPVYLRPKYSNFMYAMQTANILSALKSAEKEYEYFIIPDEVMSADSSLEVEFEDAERTKFRFARYSRASNPPVRKYISNLDLTRLLLNQVVIGKPPGICNKEYMPNLAGNYIIYDHMNNEVRGTQQSVFGYKGDSLLTLHPQLIDYPADNGSTYITEAWFRGPETEIYNLLSKYGRFMTLLDKTGLASKKEFTMKLTKPGEFYTVFAPSDSALDALGADTIHIDRLREILKKHFIRGQVLFTDMSSFSGNYKTMSDDQYRLRIIKQPDQIIILDNDNNTFVEINEDPLKTNIIIAYDTNPIGSSLSEYDFVSTGVIHEIDQVLDL